MLDHSIKITPPASLGSRQVNDHNGYLEGRLLIATPAVMGPLFQQSVVYLFAHNASGAMGLVVNKPLENVHYASLFMQLGIELSAESKGVSVYHGGPVEEHRGFVLHSAEYDSVDGIIQESGVGVTASATVLRDIAAGKGPKKSILCIGYAGWSTGQLEAEMEAGSWITAPAAPELLFDTPDDMKWNLSAKTLGVDMWRFSHVAGHA